MGFITFLTGCGVGAILGYTIAYRPTKLSQLDESNYVKHVKNALFAYALAVVFKDDMDTLDEYTEYDGTKLPCLSGHSFSNACFTYFYTSSNKTAAINRYLSRVFVDYEICYIFLEKFAKT